MLPFWLLVGWFVFLPGGWAFLWMVFSLPAVFVCQLIIALLIRARPTVRAERAVSWWDVLGIIVWNGLTIWLGTYPEQIFIPLFILTIVAGIGMFWLSLWQLWGEARGNSIRLIDAVRVGPGVTGDDPFGAGAAYFGDPSSRSRARREPEVIIVTEASDPDRDER